MYKSNNIRLFDIYLRLYLFKHLKVDDLSDIPVFRQKYNTGEPIFTVQKRPKEGPSPCNAYPFTHHRQIQPRQPLSRAQRSFGPETLETSPFDALKNLINGISQPVGPAVARVKTSSRHSLLARPLPGFQFWAEWRSLRSFAVNSQLKGFAWLAFPHVQTYTGCLRI